ncbi:Beta-1,3-glucosyltransferase [Araneus ventricosus]|uniref:Beta-1,3-glucosyltransferase n=1 Tax=Araneus ventricosus TaxID=182803 RepID=A0A4Y2EIH6_ARAVE|nr:Beta-1,3-glucosyltransferase [Araneus ventricosus]
MILYFAIFTFISNSFKCVFCLKERTENNSLGIGFVILSQSNKYHQNLAEHLKFDILSQASKLNSNIHLEVYKNHEDLNDILGNWIIWPLFRKLSKFQNVKWIFFLEDHSRINVRRAVKIVSSYDPSQDIFAGYPLKDVDPTIIHHFASPDDESVIFYPHFSAGFFISLSLIKKLVKGKCDNCHFSIDPKYELAKFIWENSGAKLIHEPRLCLRKRSDVCATWISGDFPDCGPAVSSRKISVGVKTCEKFHEDRVKVLKNTWAPDVKNLLMFSDVEDKTIPTVKVNVRNVASGHCEKTLSIMKFFLDNDTSFRWLVIADDDTLLGFQRLRKLLACYDSSEDVVLGERYGYNIWGNFGYSYPTGGSGMIFSRPAVEKLVSSCQCPSIDSPDDMIIGACLRTLMIDVTHLPFLHQARPIDYSPVFLAPFKHISFHKHWMIDPYAVYKEWLEESGQAFIHRSEL